MIGWLSVGCGDWWIDRWVGEEQYFSLGEREKSVK
jgi:hypothetical protein